MYACVWANDNTSLYWDTTFLWRAFFPMRVYNVGFSFCFLLFKNLAVWQMNLVWDHSYILSLEGLGPKWIFYMEKRDGGGMGKEKPDVWDMKCWFWYFSHLKKELNGQSTWLPEHRVHVSLGSRRSETCALQPPSSWAWLLGCKMLAPAGQTKPLAFV